MGRKLQTCEKDVQNLIGKTAGREHLITLGADKNRLKRILNLQVVNWISFVWLKTGSLGGQSNETCKGKAIPLQAWTGPEDSRRLRLPAFPDNRHMNIVSLSAIPQGNAPGINLC